jgi:SpoVK/Ycf46/Vps4 family AAA+-type ATPase
MPTLGAKPKPARPRHPLLDILSGGSANRQDDSKQSDGLIWKTVPIIPAERNHTLEMLERIRTRSLLSAALLSKAIHDLGGDLIDPVSALTRVKVEPTRVDRAGKRRGEDRVLRYYRIDDPTDPNLSKLSRGENYRIVREGWHNAVHSWSSVRQLAAAVLGQRLSQDDKKPQVTWLNVLSVCETEKAGMEKLCERIRGYIPKSKVVRHTSKTGPSTTQEPAVDSVVAKVKRAKDLSQHEKRLLGSIVDTSKLASTSFNDVHLPFKTIDAIRTIISLPLLFPEAFQGGVLKDHATTGALLFGPPGTGKTLLARAVANESGARMLAIQPSDVNDKYFGEGEKL